MKHLLLAACAALGLWLLMGARTALAAEGVASPAHSSERATAQSTTGERTGDLRTHEVSKVIQRGTDHPAETARRDDGVPSKARISSATTALREWHGQTGHATEIAEDRGCGECGHPRANGQRADRQAEATVAGAPARSNGRSSAEPGIVHEVLGSHSLAQLQVKGETRAAERRSSAQGSAISGELNSGCPAGGCFKAVGAARPGVEAATRRLARPATLARTVTMGAVSNVTPAPGGAVEPAAEGQVITHIAPAFQPTLLPDPGLQKTTRVGNGRYGGVADHQDHAGQIRLADHLLSLAVLIGAAVSVLIALGFEMRLVLIELLKGRGR